MKPTISYFSGWDSTFNLNFLSGLLIIIVFCGCEKVLMQKDASTESEAIFQEVWTVIDERYPFFELKQVDWNEVYNLYHQKAAESYGGIQLFNILGNMILELEDGHTDIHSQHGSRYYWPVSDSVMDLFNLSTIKNNYLKGNYELQNAVCFGFINETGYTHIEDFSVEITKEIANQIFNEFENTESIIIDVRNNTGGNEKYCNLLISYLIKTRLNYKITYFKKNKTDNDFASGKFYIEPNNEMLYEGNVVVLVNRASFSATNGFVSALSQLPNVTIIGDTTGGGGSTPYYYELQNGWILRYSSNKEARVSDSWLLEKGIPPEHYIKQEKTIETDNVLDFALTLLNN
jgi:hypothetical protein